MIEDMLRMYVMDQPSKWEDNFPLVLLSYNNVFHASLKTSPFDALYGRKYNTPISWDNPTYRIIIGAEILKDMEDQLVKIKQNLKVTRDIKKELCI